MTIAQFREHLQNPPKWVYGFLAAAVCGVAGFVRSGAHDDVERQLRNETESAEKTRRIIRLSVGIEDQITTLETALSAAQERLILPEQRGENLKHFYALAQQEGVTLHTIAPLPVEKGKHYARAPFTLVASGGFQDVMKFLRKIERGPYFFAPLEYTLQRGEPPSENGATRADDPNRVTLSMRFEFLAPL